MPYFQSLSGPVCKMAVTNVVMKEVCKLNWSGKIGLVLHKDFSKEKRQSPIKLNRCTVMPNGRR